MFKVNLVYKLRFSTATVVKQKNIFFGSKKKKEERKKKEKKDDGWSQGCSFVPGHLDQI